MDRRGGMPRCENGTEIGVGVFVSLRREGSGGADLSRTSQDTAIKKTVEYPFLSLHILATSSNTQ